MFLNSSKGGDEAPIILTENSVARNNIMVMRNDPKNPAPILESGWSFMEFQMSLLLWHSRKKQSRDGNGIFLKITTLSQLVTATISSFPHPFIVLPHPVTSLFCLCFLFSFSSSTWFFLLIWNWNLALGSGTQVMWCRKCW